MEVHRRSSGRGRFLRTAAVLAWLRLARVRQKTVRATAEQLKGWGLNSAQFDVLAQVGASEGIAQQELADSLLVTKGNASHLLSLMEGRGLVLRRPEGRTNRLFLTKEGRRLFEEVVPAQESFVADWFSVLSEEEQRKLHELLRKLDWALS